jgi:hypothetical protein
MSNPCDDNKNLNVPFPPSIEIFPESGSDITVRKVVMGERTHYYIGREEIKNLRLQYSTNPLIAEVGESIPLAEFNDLIVLDGREIISANINPTPSGFDIASLRSSQSWTEVNVTKDILGLSATSNGDPHILTVSDGISTLNAEIGIPFYYRMYFGYLPEYFNFDLTINAINSGQLNFDNSFLTNFDDDLAESILDIFGTGLYDLPSVGLDPELNYHLVWLVPTNSQQINNIRLGNNNAAFAVFKDTFIITNPYGVPIEYKLYYTPAVGGSFSGNLVIT